MAEPTWEELAQEIVAMRQTMGFNPVRRENLPAKIFCVIAELEEVEDAMRGGDVGEELADVAMYALAAMWDLTGGKLVMRKANTPVSMFHAPETLTAPARSQAVSAFESWRRGNLKDVQISMELVLLHIRRMALGAGVDLKAEMRRKVAKNLKRDFRHGGKHPDS